MCRTALLNTAGMLTALCALAATGPAAAETYTTFGWRSDTYPTTINAGGAVAGAGVEDEFAQGYVRAADGTTTGFSPDNSEYTWPAGINRKGSITGYYYDASYVAHGFLREPDGTLVTFDPKGSTDTEPSAINGGGVITGFHDSHGFVRAADGTITSFDPTGSVVTRPTAINANGDIAGWYNDSSNKTHGFLRTADGTIASFDVNGNPTEAYAINRNDVVVGSYYLDDSNWQTRGFERTAGGKLKTFAVENSAQTLPLGINDGGQITGTYYSDTPPYGSFHGFVGSPKAGFTTFDVPNGSETEALAINNSGVITGDYYDNATGDQPGFVRTP